MARKKMTMPALHEKKRRGEPITMVTVYDYPSALAADRAEMDTLLVGDSLAMVVLGYDSTVPVTMDEMLHHCRAARRGTTYGFLVGDMPFLSYQAETAEAVRNAGRFLKEAEMDAVKLEGGQRVIPAIRAIVDAGILVVGHIGLTPQTATQLGGYRVQGRTAQEAQRLLEDALALERAGVSMLVLEMVPDRVGQRITQKLRIPTIGIGAGARCDGQVLVMHDLIGMYDRFTPRFARQYAQLGSQLERALVAYRDEVRARTFPGPENAFLMEDAEYESWTDAP